VVALDRTDKVLPSLESIRALPSRERPSEVILAVGRNPSLQRNRGVAACRHPLVHFLDDDSFVITGTPARLAAHFDEARVSVAGGPNLPFPNASPFEKSVSAVLASWLGSFTVRNRYAPLGAVREATEKELILCNLMVRREAFVREGGFRTDLFPNEENEFLNRLMHRGHGLIYDPEAAIYRHRRKDPGAFMLQSFRYGRGRGQQMRVYPCLSDVVHMVPSFFLIYVLLLAASLFLPSAGPLAFLKTAWFRAPFALFSALALYTGISGMSWHRQLHDVLLIPTLIFLRQALYGAGLLAGLVGGPSAPRSTDVSLFRASLSGRRVRLTPLRVPAGRPR
jgi:hypothetical protein